jgi:hypothetical protein
MALPVPANTTCDLYRSGNAPPSPPDVAGVSGYLQGDYMRRMETGEHEAAGMRYTHVLLLDASVDVRDGFNAWPSAGSSGDGVYVPDQTGTRFVVRFVELKQRGGSAYKKVYLDRTLLTWPTNNL